MKTVDLGCGKPTTNPRFERTRPAGPLNPRYVLRILSGQKTQLAAYACVPGAPA